MPYDRAGLAEFLRHRREALQPEDVGLPRGPRRRTEGLRREEVAALAFMSTDYYSRIEQERGPQPSEQMIAAICQGLHLSLEERDHVFRLAGHPVPARGLPSEHISPGMLRIFDRLTDTPAEIVTEIGETLRQTPLSAALVGDLVSRTGLSRSIGYRWFADPRGRERYAPADHARLSRLFASGLRELVGTHGPSSRAAAMAEALLRESEEFRMLWEAQIVGERPTELKRFVHPEVGELELTCQTLLDTGSGHSLLVYTAVPGSPSAQRLQLLSVIGTTLTPTVVA